MCVAKGAREKIISRRKEIFLGETIDKLIAEARALGIPMGELIKKIENKEGAGND
jgi:DNA-binding transcriptional regulator YhcF (GntR family)